MQQSEFARTEDNEQENNEQAEMTGRLYIHMNDNHCHGFSNSILSLERQFEIDGQVAFDDISKEYRSFNRGNKLLKTTTEPLRFNPDAPSIHANRNIDDETKFEQLSKKRVILHKKKEMQNDRIILDEQSPYYGIQIEDFWGVAEKEQDLAHMPAAIHTLKSGALNHFGSMFMIIIEEEKRVNQLITRLGDILLDDDVYMKRESVSFSSQIPNELLRESRKNLHDYLCTHTEYLNRLAHVRGKIMGAFKRKEQLAERLFETMSEAQIEA